MGMVSEAALWVKASQEKEQDNPRSPWKYDRKLRGPEGGQAVSLQWNETCTHNCPHDFSSQEYVHTECEVCTWAVFLDYIYFV